MERKDTLYVVTLLEDFAEIASGLELDYFTARIQRALALLEDDLSDSAVYDHRQLELDFESDEEFKRSEE